MHKLPIDISSVEKTEPTKMASHELQYLYDISVKIKPKILLESGTHCGQCSTYALFAALVENKTGILYTYEIHKPFFDAAVAFYIKIKNSEQAIVLKNEDFVLAVKNLSNDFFKDVDFVFLDGGDERADGGHKLPGEDYLKNIDISENVQSFKLLECRANDGTHVILHD